MKEFIDEFKEIKNIPGYSINRNGVIKNTQTDYILKPNINKDGYYSVTIRVKGKRVTARVHRLVAVNFIPNINKLPVVNHKDGNKLNNHVSNLEWSTVRNNTVHGYELELNSLAVKIRVTNVKTNKSIMYRSIQYLSEVLNVDDKLLIAYIKNSDKYPFMGKYTITILNEDKLIYNLNSSNFGKPIYVYDILEDKVSFYKSIGVASYFTGLRSLSKLKPGTIEELGYYIANEDFLTKPKNNIDLNTIKKNREEYLSRDYTPRPSSYAVIDLLSDDKTSRIFNSITELTKYMWDKHHIVVDKPYITNIKLRKGFNTRLVLGYAIQQFNHINDLLPWNDFTEEQIINSRHRKRSDSPVYKVIIENQKSIFILGTHSLLSYIRPYITNTNILYKDIHSISLEDIIKSINNELVKVTRASR